MANHGFGSGEFGGAAGFGGPFGMGAVPGGGGLGSGDLDALARQYWSAWGEQLRAAGAPAQPAAPGWNEAIGWWSQLARGGRTDTNDMLDRFNTQARGWFAQMQQLATQFSGKDGSPADIARVWKQSLGDNPFANVLQGMQGPGQHGLEQWLEQAAPYLESMQQSGKGLLGLPTFGLTREHQQRWQQMAQAQLDHQQHSKAYQGLMAEAGKQAFARFEARLAEHSEPGRQLGSARALFDLWIDAAEEAYAEIALSPKFREVYGEFVNSQMRVRAAVQHEIEETCELFGIPGRTEVDGAHRKIVQLERELRRLRDAVERGAEAVTAAPPTPAPASAGAKATKASAAAPKAATAVARSAPAARKAAPAARKSAPAALKSAPAKSAAAKSAPAKTSPAKRGAAVPLARPAASKRKTAAKSVTSAATSAAASRRTPAAAAAKRKR